MGVHCFSLRLRPIRQRPESGALDRILLIGLTDGGGREPLLTLLGTKGALGTLAKVWSLRGQKMDKCLLSFVFCLAMLGKTRLFLSPSS